MWASAYANILRHDVGDVFYLHFDQILDGTAAERLRAWNVDLDANFGERGISRTPETAAITAAAFRDFLVG